MEHSHYDSKGRIVSWRPKHPSRIKTFKERNKSIEYTDEFRVNAGHIVQEMRTDKTDEPPRQAFEAEVHRRTPAAVHTGACHE
jgi:hypothetical protein